jgi:hypothetical protein
MVVVDPVVARRVV